MAGTLELTTGDYSALEVVPSAAMNRKIENFMLPFSGGSIPAAPLTWVKWQAYKMPWACDIVQVSAWCSALMTGGSIDIYEGAASILSAPIDLAADTHVAGTISDASIAQDAELSMRVLAEGAIIRVVAQVTVAID